MVVNDELNVIRISFYRDMGEAIASCFLQSITEDPDIDHHTLQECPQDIERE